MQGLPEELQEEVLLSLREPRDLYQACSTSTDYRRICSGSSFWREKFAREGLPVLEEGENLSSWLKIYEKSTKDAQITDDIISSGESLEIALERLSDPFLLAIPGYEKELVRIWEGVQSRASQRKPQSNVQDRISSETNYYIYLLPVDYSYTIKVVRERRRNLFGQERSVRTILYELESMSKEDAWFFVYRLVYFGYRF
ncbi:F-box domain-containing protein [Brazilian cedratvirus IHUMI]|uniref:F-box domain-containing protein n=1 Tax=Brazilian cedratvirus IHUMI TaxID=2126980 RepID=A0A2R8FER0_9VIRU|nr:F-box domain-containing protein [Brazilian cedratvirus IHUMI]